MENGNNILDNIAFTPRNHSGTELRENAQRAKIAIILIGIVTGLVAVMLISDMMQYNLLKDAELGLISTEEAEANDMRQLSLMGVYLTLYIVSTVFFIRWFRRAYYNLGLAGINTLFTEGWAAGSWFVPFVNLGRPYKIMNEIWEENSALVERVSPDRYYDLTGGKVLVGLWWTVEIIAIVLSRVESWMSKKAYTIEKLQSATMLSMVNDCVIIVTGLLLLVLVRKISAMEKEVFDNQHLIAAQPVIV